MFAISRTDRVIGRIKFLVSSIITIKFIRGIGVLCGTMCLRMMAGFLNNPIILILSHIDNDRGKITEIWEDSVKFCG